MKKVLFVLFALGCLNMSSYASRLEAKASNEVELTVKYHDPTAGNNDLPRGPVEIPQVFIDSYTLYITGANGNYTLQLETADGVYSPLHHATTMNIALGQMCAYFCHPDSFTYQYTAPDSTYYLDWSSIMAECNANGGNLVNGAQNIAQVNDLLAYLDYDNYEETFYKSIQCLNFMRQLGYDIPYSQHAFGTNNEEDLIYGYLSTDHLIYARGYTTAIDIMSHLYSGGGAWAIDGMNQNYYHCNWGFYGNLDGYFASSGFRNYQYQLAFVAVKPEP